MVNIINHSYLILDEYKNDESDTVYVFTFRRVPEYDTAVIHDLTYLLQEVFKYVNWEYSVEVNLKDVTVNNMNTIKVLIGVFRGLMEKECSFCKLILPVANSAPMNFLIQSSVNTILSCARIKNDVTTLGTESNLDSIQNADNMYK